MSFENFFQICSKRSAYGHEIDRPPLLPSKIYHFACKCNLVRKRNRKALRKRHPILFTPVCKCFHCSDRRESVKDLTITRQERIPKAQMVDRIERLRKESRSSGRTLRCNICELITDGRAIGVKTSHHANAHGKHRD